MAIHRKLNLARYKKTIHGLIEFAMLIEQADPVMRDKIIANTRTQDADFLFDVMRRVVYFEELSFLDEGIIAEILAVISPKLLAYAMIGMDKQFTDTLFSHLAFRDQKQVFDEREKLGEVNKVPEGMILGARKQILKAARQLEAEGKFVLEALSSPRFHTKSVRRPSVASSFRKKEAG